MKKKIGRKDAMRMVLNTLSAVRRAQLEVRKAKIRAKSMSKLVSKEEYNNLLIVLETIDVVLERVALRLQTILASGILTRDLILLPKAVIERTAELSSTIPPSLTQSLAEITDMLEVLAAIAPTPPDTPIYSLEAQPPSEEIEEVLREAREEARKRLEPEGMIG
ncbi:MAG: hypothetical protein F7C82_00915 [Desulfurococcales archaeon]|nr:hypothetical protein [Desulfurococcales archaeon]MCE4622900.1 hypothetical protein [Desulfurococcales archaeon]MCE4626692.1 hypothetical protein [Desulfurococcales archaeon]MCE4628822.1 hypothetical protein [Desulfurococcales archaeon]